MGINVAIEHRTTYNFDRATTIHPHVLRLRPAPHSRTPILAYSLKVTPEDHFVNWQQDPFGNYMARLVFNEQARQLEFTVDLVADLTVINPFDFFVDSSAEHFPFTYDPQTLLDLDAYLRPAYQAGPHMRKWLDGIDRSKRTPINDFLVDINQRLYKDIGYSVRMEPGVQNPEETFERQIGSCRDTGWLLVEALRHLGLAARFVSGYLVQLTSDQKSLDGPSGPEKDFTDLHAWCEVYVPGAGWIGLDPTSGLFAGEGHIPLACTPHPVSAAPITGATSKTEVEFDFANIVTRVREDPRVTLPYTPEQWSAIDALGTSVDERLQKNDVRLTMGGEPTFVSIDDMEGDEWNTAADSPAKRALAHDLTERLRDRFAPGGLVQYGQGKWYPGEPLPRWQMGIVWRRDGEPLWGEPKLLADPSLPGTSTTADADAVIRGIADRFGIEADAVMAAYEDPIEQVWHEARLPAGDPPAVDVTDDEADAIGDGDARRQLLDRLSGPAADPVGYVLPLRPDDDGDGWVTTEWTLRRGRLYLVGGDSPIGLRLPIDSLTWRSFPSPFERSPFEPRSVLPQPGVMPEPIRSNRRDFTDLTVVDPAAPTAIAVETRDGHVRVFLPPLESADRAIELLHVLEDVASELDLPIVVEGYPIPRDPRLDMLMVTPDPGVIEVNVQPTATWADQRDVVETIYDEARRTRLGTEKFDLDGSHTGTGGGNHVTLGGVTPADSPLLRRPDLLRSMVTYWQHHPSLSFLFSGQFIGPTSQAPRVDEGRADTLYELEVAFAELERASTGTDGDGQVAPPWIVDRLLRHLLVDLTGNTHRSEFCIDKLFSPDSERGRLGILELRAFEMPPHEQMALVQALLVRSLVARFWEEPYTGPLVRWGTELNDRFMLPHFVRADIHDVVADLNDHGIDFASSWFDPFLEFRFPLIGEAVVSGGPSGDAGGGEVRLEVRRAIEPWHVLGEESSGSGTSRYVDSSVERLQVQVDGINPERHIVTCNGIPLPLRATGTAGTSVAGVRFKAWAPWSALHPTIDKTGPLHFDVVDRWSSRSLGGATYHIVHPGGRGYDAFPINAAEAETRRGSRFIARDHTPGRVDIAALDEIAARIPHEHPRTLDLRKFAGLL